MRQKARTRGARLALLALACAALAGCARVPAAAGRPPASPAPSAVLGTPVAATATLAPSPPPAPPSATPAPPTPTATPRPTPAPPTVRPTAAPPAGEAPESEALALLNAARAAAGCAVALRPDPALAAAARRHSDDMAAGDFVGHTGSDGTDAGRRIADAGFAFGAVAPGEPLWAENVAAGFPDAPAAVRSWLDSPGHRANILTCGFNAAGLGLARREGTRFTTYWAIVFAAGP